MRLNSIEHVGWITENQAKFESFWCDILGFKTLKTGKVTSKLTETLFDIKGGAKIVRYGHEDIETDIEIHIFLQGATMLTLGSFDEFGINHICLNVPDKEQFMAFLPETVTRKIYQNPLGWTNTFIKDFEDNWIEIREPYKQEIFSSSYKSPEVDSFITSFVATISPNKVVEIGAQQGKSTVLIAKGLDKTAEIYTYDLFEKSYDSPPYLDTHADKEIVISNLKTAKVKCGFSVNKARGEEALKQHDKIDLLHIDICNHYDNLKPLLELAVDKVSKAILLEGGIENSWQKKYGFKPYDSLLQEDWIASKWSYITIPFNEHNAITILTKRVK
jgi:catechol 2,3-dioxygenase-like lactoylglutathione lyase family enzyme